MSTAVSICSNALIMLGDDPINSFDDDPTGGGLDRARIAQNLWPQVRDAVLRSHPWNCAATRATLSPETSAPAFGWSYSYVLPADWLRNIEINGARADFVDYQVESRPNSTAKLLLTDEGTLNLRYVFKNTDVGSWDPLLVDCASLAMASRLAYPIAKSTSLRDSFLADLNRELARARAVDGQDESPQQLGSFEILDARRTIGTSYDGRNRY